MAVEGEREGGILQGLGVEKYTEGGRWTISRTHSEVAPLEVLLLREERSSFLRGKGRRE